VICYRRQGVPTVRMTKSQCKGLARGSRARGTVSRGPLGRPVNVTTVTTFLGTKAVSLARAWKQSVGPWDWRCRFSDCNLVADARRPEFILRDGDREAWQRHGEHHCRGDDRACGSD